MDAAYREHWSIPVILWDLQDPALVLLDRFHQVLDGISTILSKNFIAI
jgi:hypothetical protein